MIGPTHNEDHVEISQSRDSVMFTLYCAHAGVLFPVLKMDSSESDDDFDRDVGNLVPYSFEPEAPRAAEGRASPVADDYQQDRVGNREW